MSGTRALYVALAAYAIGFIVWWPRAFLVIDEERYVSQAVAFVHGSTTVPGASNLSDSVPRRFEVDYPPGTSLLQTPFVAIGGWRGAMALSLLALIVATLVTGAALRRLGFDPAFALVVPGFLGSAFFGRIGMSDVPSAALVACFLLAALRGRNSSAWSLAAGFALGAGALLREPLVVLMAPIALGVSLRGDVRRAPLIAGLAVAVVLRLALSEWLFGSPLYVRDSGYGFSLASLRFSLPVYAPILLLMLPAGALLPFFYRGRWRRELVASVALYVTMFLLYEYDSVTENGRVKGLVLASRFIVPLTPLFALMAADVWPRWLAFLRTRPALLRAAVGAAVAGIVGLGVGIHLVARAQETVSITIRDGIYGNTAQERPVLINAKATLKYLSPSYGARQIIERDKTAPDSVAERVRANGAIDVALLDRNDSDMFRSDAEDNAAFVARLAERCSLDSTLIRPVADWARLSVLTVTRC